MTKVKGFSRVSASGAVILGVDGRGSPEECARKRERMNELWALRRQQGALGGLAKVRMVMDLEKDNESMARWRKELED
jgi:hypothetical protein